MTACQLLNALEQNAPSLRETLRGLYGAEADLLEERRAAYRRAVSAFCRRFDGDGEIIVARAPGRVNLMGRHVDHRGGYCNPIALNLEVVLVAQKRTDDRLCLHNCDTEHPDRDFALADELPPGKLDSLAVWDEWTLERVRLRERQGLSRHWTLYPQAAAVNFQDLLRRDDGGFAPALSGMNAVVLGNLPPSAGLSSSSALFVSTAEALLHFAGVEYAPGEFADHCGRGEWYVGTRGGSGDHAAMKFGRRGQISHIGFFPTTIDHVDFPPGYRVVIADSKDEAHKAGGARDKFNQRVAAYEVGLMLLQESFPARAEAMEHLRDVNPQTLGCSEAEIYGMLQQLPSTAARDELLDLLPANRRDRLQEIFAAHAAPEEGYLVRDVCLYGIAECLRSRDCFDLLQSGDLGGFGRLMTVSHDGDRVCSHDAEGTPRRFSARVSDQDLNRLIAGSHTGEQSAALCRQPGGYECSTQRVDRMVDLALSTPGVIGAQISGAGLGGCMMALVETDRAEELLRVLESDYYAPAELEPSAHACTPVQGSGVVDFTN